MTKFTIENKQFDEIKNEIQNALQQIGIDYGYDYDVITKTCSDMSIIDALYFMYNTNEHRIDTTDMYKFLTALNDYEQNGVVENFETYNVYDNE